MKRFGKVALPTLGGVAMLAYAAGSAAAQGLKEKIVGTWTIVSVVLEEAGSKREPFGPNPDGLFIFTSDGHFAAHIVRRGRPKFASNNREAGSPEENKAAIQGYISVFGTYTVNEADQSVSQHIIGSSFPNWDGTNQKRFAEIAGDELKWTNPTPATGGTGSVTQILKRAKSK